MDVTDGLAAAREGTDPRGADGAQADVAIATTAMLAAASSR